MDETPYCVWEWDLPERDLEFVESIDPEYFAHAANICLQLMGEETPQHVALLLRWHYAQALETFFALLCAAVQAPDCVVGWFARYTLGDLRRAVEKIHRGRPLLSKLRPSPLTWEVLSTHINHFSEK